MYLVRTKAFFRIAKQALVERIQFDWPVLKAGLVLRAVIARINGYVTGRRGVELDALGSLWRRTPGTWVDHYCDVRLRRLMGGAPEHKRSLIEPLIEKGFDYEFGKRLSASLGEAGGFDRRLLVLRDQSPNDKGIVIVKYTNYFRYFYRLFTGRLFEDYHVVLEPSWIGVFLPEILCFGLTGSRVFVQAWEERDFNALLGFGSGLIPVPCGPNGWVNPDVFFPVHNAAKEYDAIMVSLWSDFKRHYALFRALKEARNRRIRIACVGEPWPRTRREIEDLAIYYGVRSQVDFYESVTQAELNMLFNRSRVTLLMSRKEGSNKSIVESMFAGTPAFLRTGHNYGTSYPFLNEATGGFVRENELPRLLQRIHAGAFDGLSPRAWVLKHWSPITSTGILERTIYGDEEGRVAVKVNAPDLDYLFAQDRERLKEANARLREYLK